VPFNVAEEGVEQDEAGALSDAPQHRVARRAGHARPAVEPRDDQHLERGGAGQVALDVAVDDLEVVAVAAVGVVVVVADAPAVDVPVAVDGDGRRGELKALHQLDHVAAVLDRGDEEALDGAARELPRPGHVRRRDLGRVGDVVLVEVAPADPRRPRPAGGRERGEDEGGECDAEKFSH
jgi:hypothetical protein